ncbi:MAG: helix-turn-helix domain-containing protein [Gammaproteobacteria bacterium]|nr:helix-turn-helix domain-containing protein [Gammaproteobacteria bacterium]
MDEVAFGPVGRRLAQLLESKAPVAHTTHQELAAELGSSREVVSRYLKRYEDQGWIKLRPGEIEVLDPVALRQLAERNAV